MRSDLVVRLDGTDTGPLMETWRWLLPPTLRPWFATALGDLFLVGQDGQVWWLDVGSGQARAVERTPDEFQRLAADPEHADLWFGEALVDAIRASGLLLGPGECYSYRQLPMLGGEYAAPNFRTYDVTTHFRVWGPLHEQLKDLPEGAQVQFDVR